MWSDLFLTHGISYSAKDKPIHPEAPLLQAILCLALLNNLAQADLRKDEDSQKVAKKAAQYIVKEGRDLPKGTTDIALKELKNICSDQLHKGCYFWEKGSKISFQPLDQRGKRDGKIYELDGWLKRLFTKK